MKAGREREEKMRKRRIKVTKKEEKRTVRENRKKNEEGSREWRRRRENETGRKEKEKEQHFFLRNIGHDTKKTRKNMVHSYHSFEKKKTHKIKTKS